MDYSINDATDFVCTSIPQLSQLDALIRCNVCKEILKTPVLTPCSHTFCSLCIRKYLTKEAKCPLCLSELRESNLRSEFLVNEIIECYKSVRVGLLETLKNTKDNRNYRCPIELSDDSDDDDLQILGTNPKKEIKRGKTENSTGKINKRTTFIKASSLLNQQSVNHRVREQLAQCPVCAQFYPIQVLERTHLDECLTMRSLHEGNKVKGGSPKSYSPRMKTTNSSTLKKVNNIQDGRSHVNKYLSSFNTDQRRERLPKINFTSMSVSQIKQKLASMNLPTHGSKQNMVARYNHYEVLWNSNFCDSIAPVEENELKRQLASWEASHNLSNCNTGTNIISKMIRSANHGSSYQTLLEDFKTDNFQRKTWIHMFRNDFKNLINEARNTKSRGVRDE